MTFRWPWLLLGLLALPALVAAYRRALARRADRLRRLAELGLATGPPGRRRGRHLPAVLVLVALGLMTVAAARPQATIAQPHREGTVILAFDASASMAATDLSPNRLAAAKQAARDLVARQPAAVRVGVVAFSDSGLVTEPPTADRARVLAAIDRLTPQGGTALARGLQTSLSAIAGRTVQLADPNDPGSGDVEQRGQDLGYFGSAAVVLLSDGQNTAGPDPVEVARTAATAGVKVYPVGVGSPAGTVLQLDGFQVATALDQGLLRQIADTTGGRYFAAADAQALRRVYRSIHLAWTVRAERTEVTALVAMAAAVLLLAGSGLTFARTGRVV